jgi:N-acetylglucosaminyldiphosphoundecaprenol N-acetyl-beta-D-mannosaminyltransferase
MYKKIDVMGYGVFIDELSNIKIGDDKQIINTINPHSFVVAKDDKLFEEALKNSDTLLPDGSGIVLASKVLQHQKIKKIAGANLHSYLLDLLNNSSGKVFYMGASQDTLNIIEEKISKEYPNIEIDSFSPPFKDNFSDEENKNIIDRVNRFNPDILFIGMTAPKQEKWLYQNRDSLNFKIASSIGAVFDFYAGKIERPSLFWINIHLEWLPRFLKEPRRLWRRNFISTPIFLFELLKYSVKMK